MCNHSCTTHCLAANDSALLRVLHSSSLLRTVRMPVEARASGLASRVMEDAHLLWTSTQHDCKRGIYQLLVCPRAHWLMKPIHMPLFKAYIVNPSLQMDCQELCPTLTSLSSKFSRSGASVFKSRRTVMSDKFLTLPVGSSRRVETACAVVRERGALLLAEMAVLVRCCDVGNVSWPTILVRCLCSKR